MEEGGARETGKSGPRRGAGRRNGLWPGARQADVLLGHVARCCGSHCNQARTRSADRPPLGHALRRNAVLPARPPAHMGTSAFLGGCTGLANMCCPPGSTCVVRRARGKLAIAGHSTQGPTPAVPASAVQGPSLVGTRLPPQPTLPTGQQTLFSEHVVPGGPGRATGEGRGQANVARKAWPCWVGVFKAAPMAWPWAQLAEDSQWPWWAHAAQPSTRASLTKPGPAAPPSLSQMTPPHWDEPAATHWFWRQTLWPPQHVPPHSCAPAAQHTPFIHCSAGPHTLPPHLLMSGGGRAGRGARIGAASVAPRVQRR